MTLLKNKHEIANFIGKVFQDEKFVSFINENLAEASDKEKAFSRFFGNFLYFVVATRSTKIKKSTLKKLFKWSAEQTFMAGKELVEELITQLSNQNQLATTQNVLQLFESNFVENGVYMHAFNGTFKPFMEKFGANVKQKLDFNEIKNRISSYVEYPYAEKSYRFFVSGRYEILYGYGSQSPEWFYYLVKSPEVFYFKDAKKASQLILENIKQANPHFNNERLAEIEKDAKHLSKALLGKNFKISVALVDRNLKTETGQRVFPEYLEEDTFEKKHFTTQNFESFLKKSYQTATNVENAKQNTELLGKYINKLIADCTLYETSTYHTISPENIAFFDLPDTQKLNLKQRAARGPFKSAEF